jgi:hypothetical protein
MQHEGNAAQAADIDPHELAEAASRVLSTKQQVRPGQAAKYLPLLTEDNPIPVPSRWQPVSAGVS